MNSLPAAIAYFNASPVAFLPYGTDFPVTDGTLTAEVVLTRCNTFGTTIKQGKREGLIVQGLPDYKRFYRFINLIRAKFYAFFVQMNKVVVADNFFLHRVNKPV